SARTQLRRVGARFHAALPEVAAPRSPRGCRDAPASRATVQESRPRRRCSRHAIQRFTTRNAFHVLPSFRSTTDAPAEIVVRTLTTACVRRASMNSIRKIIGYVSTSIEPHAGPPTWKNPFHHVASFAAEASCAFGSEPPIFPAISLSNAICSAFTNNAFSVPGSGSEVETVKISLSAVAILNWELTSRNGGGND